MHYILGVDNNMDSLHYLDVTDWLVRLPMTIYLNATWRADYPTPEFIHGIKVGFLAALRRMDGYSMVPDRTVKLATDHIITKKRSTDDRVRIHIDFTGQTHYQ